MRFSQLLETKRLALWGWGKETYATYNALRAYERVHAVDAPLPITIFCPPDASIDAIATDPKLNIAHSITADHLSRFPVIVKSPGISPYSPIAREVCRSGTILIGSTHLWFAEKANAHSLAPGTLCITGTKGKSTSSALLAHILRSAGFRCGLAGNIGLPLLDVVAPQPEPDYWVIELSSFQTGDVADSTVRPLLAIVLNLFSEHGDWHGSTDRYIHDKLRLITEAQPHIVVLNAKDTRLRTLQLQHSHCVWFNTTEGWHVQDKAIYMGQQHVFDANNIMLPGQHNLENFCALLAALDALDLDAFALAQHIRSFKPLPHRLQILGCKEGITWVNDSISTTPQATLSALHSFSDQPVALIVGGYDRGIDWNSCASNFHCNAPLTIITHAANGPHIFSALAPYAAQYHFRLLAVDDLTCAMAAATMALKSSGGIALLSPGAPSFGPYKNYIARGMHFAELAGFARPNYEEIAGLGVF